MERIIEVNELQREMDELSHRMETGETLTPEEVEFIDDISVKMSDEDFDIEEEDWEDVEDDEEDEESEE